VNTDCGGKEQFKRWIFNFLRKREVERAETVEFNIGEEVAQ